MKYLMCYWIGSLGKGIGPNPIDRAKCGTKRSILVDGKTEHNSKIKHS